MSNHQSEELQPLQDDRATSGKAKNDRDNAKEPAEPIRILARHIDIHTEETSNQIERDEDGSDQSDFAEQCICLVALGDIVDRDLCKVVGVRTAQHLLKVRQIGHHGHYVVLHVGKIEADVTTRRDGVLLVAAFGEALDDVCLATEETDQGHNLLAAISDLS